ncbi:hypothetical protein Y032_0017g3459 [Ancylostoma ceylanicum]|uniref:Uncharacterized protein n=1 Tax=Ancylostoma ceylanicum TaxID=53326 RepID=A0A016V6K2_9BILA|nr:hypothetical protein Y032_0017g3459 [Ancylostoma ceylanicum]
MISNPCVRGVTSVGLAFSAAEHIYYTSLHFTTFTNKYVKIINYTNNYGRDGKGSRPERSETASSFSITGFETKRNGVAIAIARSIKEQTEVLLKSDRLVWASAASTILMCAGDTLRETKRGRKGDRVAWYRSEDLQKIVKAKEDVYKAWHKTKSFSALIEYKLR